MKTERARAARDGFWQVAVPDEEDWAAASGRVPELAPEERLAAVQRYLTARYGGILPEGGAADDRD